MQEERRGQTISCESQDPPESSMVRRGSTVRVGQKASQESAEKWALSCSDGLAPPRTRFRHGALARFHLDRFGPTVLARIGREVATGLASGELRESPRCSSTASSTPADTTPRASSQWTQDDRGLRIVAHEPLKPLCRYARAIEPLRALQPHPPADAPGTRPHRVDRREGVGTLRDRPFLACVRVRAMKAGRRLRARGRRERPRRISGKPQRVPQAQGKRSPATSSTRPRTSMRRSNVGRRSRLHAWADRWRCAHSKSSDLEDALRDERRRASPP
jgi:hypothetical protein